jgi:hypothetical protein
LGTETIYNSSEIEQQMEVNSVLLLNEARQTPDLYLRQRLYEQAEAQETTLFSEVLNGSVNTDFAFETEDGKLYLLQPNGVTDWQLMHRHGRLRAGAKAAENPAFQPYEQIAEAEYEEARMQEAMVRSGAPAIMAKLSMCGNDVMSAAQLEEIGRHPELQRAFLRVTVFDGQKLHIHSRSIDGLNLADGRGIATGWGTWETPEMDLSPDASSVDILQNQLYFGEDRMSIGQMHQLADKLVGAYDGLQTRRTGRIHKAGRCPQATETYKFVLDNRDLLNVHMASLAELAARRDLPLAYLADITNNLRYDIMSSLKQRLDGTWVDTGGLSESVAAAGDIERAEGTQYKGCDTVIGSKTAENTGYVNAQNHEVNSKCVKCPSCKNIVDLPEELLRKNIMHCVKCKASVHTKGGKVDQNAIDDFYGAQHQEAGGSKIESFSEYWERLGHELKLKRSKQETQLNADA